jgi:hypothetical protein
MGMLESDLAADTSEMSIDDPRTQALIYKAAALVYSFLQGTPTGQSVGVYAAEQARFEGEYLRAKRTLQMPRMGMQIGWSIYG